MQPSFADLEVVRNGVLRVRATNNRAKDESASAFGQWIHDCLPRDFDTMDLDVVVRAQATGILRIVERKKPGQEIKPSQQRILPVLARGLALLEQAGLVRPGSGVFTIWCADEEIERAVRARESTLACEVKRIKPIGSSYQLLPEPVRDISMWLRCRE